MARKVYETVKILTIGWILYTFSGATSPAWAASRCQADLARVHTDFCIGDEHAAASTPPTALSYHWRVDEQVFDLGARLCLSSGAAIGARRDTVFAVDRSVSIAAVDASRHKAQSDNLALLQAALIKLRAEAKADPSSAPKIGVVLFSTANNCQPFSAGGQIAVNREFPCVYVVAKPLTDDTHFDNLQALIKAADTKYSEQGAAASDYRIVTALMTAEKLGLAAQSASGLIMLSDGRSYMGAASDPYVFLRSGNYTDTQAAMKQAFAKMRPNKLVFALDPVNNPAYDDAYNSAYDTMCQSAGAAAADCSGGVSTSLPSSWPVNKLNTKNIVNDYVQAAGGGDKQVVLLNGPGDMDTALESLRITDRDQAAVKAVAYSVNGGPTQTGEMQGSRLLLSSLPSASQLQVDVRLTTAGGVLKLPLTLATAQEPLMSEDLVDAEMLCSGVAPSPTLAQLQGGGVRCGAVGSGTKVRLAGLCLLLLAPLALLFGRGLLPLALLMIGLTTAAANLSAAPSDGLDVLQFRPVVDGVGNTEKATTLAPWTFNTGVFFSYAKDPLELGDHDHHRESSVMDHLETAHVVGNVGLSNRITLSLHLPYVHNAAETRQTDGQITTRGQLGQLADSDAMVKINLVDRSPYALALAPIATIPSGRPSLLTGDGSTGYGALLLASGRHTSLSWAVNGGYLQLAKAATLSDDRAASIRVGGQWQANAGAEYLVYRSLALGLSLQDKATPGSGVAMNEHNPAEWDLVAKLRAAGVFDVEAGGGTGIGPGFGAPAYRLFAGLSFVPGAKH